MKARPYLYGPVELSLVFPAFDEGLNLDPLLESALALAPQLSEKFEIIVVDDGSSDGSAETLGRWQRRDPRIRGIHHATNLGYGAALRTGLQCARGELIFFSDADLQFDLAELKSLLAHADSFDIVAGYRAPRRDPWGRRVLGWGWTTLVRNLFGLRIRDIDCAFKLFRRHVLTALPISALGAFVNTEILVRATNAGYRIHQVPVSHRPRARGRQTGANLRVIGKALYEAASLYRELHSTKTIDLRNSAES